MNDDHEHDRTTRILRALRDRPYDGRDPETSWGQLRGRLGEPGRARREARLGWLGWLWGHEGIVALACLAIVVAYLVGSAGQPAGPPVMASDESSAAPAPSSPLVLVAEGNDSDATSREPDAAVAVAPSLSTVQGFSIDVRVVRASDDPAGTFIGAGGADPIGDIRPLLESAFPAKGFEVTDSWSGELADRRGGLLFESSVDPETGDVLLRNVRYGSADGDLIADELSLQPGRVYVIGLPGSTELLLAVRLQQTTPSEAPGARDDDGDR